MDLFDKFINRILGHEGGYVNDRRDPGGETKWGISKRSYPHRDIKNLSRSDAIAIYRQDFWWANDFQKLPPLVGFHALDAAVNHGAGNAIRWLQRAANVADDGIVGPATRRALEAAEPMDLVLRFNAERLDFYTRLQGWPVYGKGWTRRIADNLRYTSEDN